MAGQGKPKTGGRQKGTLNGYKGGERDLMREIRAALREQADTGGISYKFGRMNRKV